MTEECDRNPSPPKELLESSDDLVPDKIGETVFSKHWVFQCLIHVIQAVEKEDEKPEASSEKEQNETNNSGKEEGDKTEVLELNKELEEELCTLWDMSANNDVAHFLHEFKASNIFLGVIEKTKAPRLAEIAVGILGNMMFFNDICEDVSKNEELVKVLLLLLNSSDSPTLVQVVRLVHVCVVNKKARRTWLNSFKEIGSFVKTLQFILGNSLNVDLLKGTLQVVYYILHASEDFSLQFGSSEFVTAITAAAEQLRLKEAFEALDEYWHVIHLLSLNEDNLKILGECFHSIYKLLHVYVSKLCDNEDVVPSYERIGALTGGFATLVALLTPERLDEELFDRGR
ncbi:protein saal1 isoform X2 [Tachypleus tridentatus]|uniref:protein saal1 isoform X2 n=1 Tax=Tachypleus tridentatus TaxID=6853 RepID=UPI003FD65E15